LLRLTLIPALLLALATVMQVTHAAASASVKLWRLDCGSIRVDDLNEYSDTYAHVGKSGRFTVSCYLIKHGNSYLLWDTGLSDKALSPGERLMKSLPEQLAQIGVEPEQIDIIGISHYHYDHMGQAYHFPQARLLMGQGDVKVLQAPGIARAKMLAHWISGPGKLQEVVGDEDIFGDQTVVMLDLPGHTPGHHGLLVKLAKAGPILLSGDVAHFRENYESNGVPSFNFDRAQTLASLDRFKGIARNRRATVIIQHEETDVRKLPRFPAFAE